MLVLAVSSKPDLLNEHEPQGRTQRRSKKIL